jgi:uncharacterized membrane protein YkvA (DUF1232 family)
MKNKLKKIGHKQIIWIIAAILYIVFPIDLIPEFLFPIGGVDDLAVLIALIYQLLVTFDVIPKIGEDNKKTKNKDKRKEDYIDAEIIE